MGCGASAKGPPRELDEAEKQRICNIACKEMETRTCKFAITQFDQIIVNPPNEVNQFRDNAKRCRDAGEEAKAKIAEIAGGGNAEAIGEKVVSGGILGGMMGSAAKMVDKAAELSGDAAGKAINLALHTAAEGMDAAVDAIEEPFTAVGRDIVKAKEKEIVDIFVAYINGFDFPNAFNLIRAGSSDSISTTMTVAMVQPLAKQLLPIVQAEIDKHAVTKAWDLAIEKTNEMIAMFQEKVPDLMDKYGPKPIKLDINIHIVTKVIEQIAKIMGTKEAEVRAAVMESAARHRGAGLPYHPKLFEACFDKDIVLTVEHLDEKNHS